MSKKRRHRPHFLGEVGFLGLSLSLLESPALILWGTYDVLVELQRLRISGEQDIHTVPVLGG